MELTIWLVLLYGILVAVGGIIGYVKVKSLPSLISGLVSGLALAIAWYVASQTPLLGFAIASGIALVLLVVFILRFRATRAIMPAGMMAILSFVAMAVFATSCFFVNATG